MATSPQLMRAVNFALVSTGAVGTMFAMPTVLAQETAAQGSDELEQIVVTGSRIRRVDAETASPVFTLDREAITETGVNTMGDLLQQIADGLRRCDQPCSQQRRRLRRSSTSNCAASTPSAPWCC